MNQYEVTALIAEELPEADKDLPYLAALGNLNRTMSILSLYTKQMIVAHNFRQVQKCMQLADSIYRRGNAVVKKAVENIFVFSFSFMRLSCNKVEWHIAQAKIPGSLYSVYMKQVMQSSC